MKSKKCFKCGKSRPLSAFYAHPQMGDGHLGKCKECTKLDVRKHRRENVERLREYDRQRFTGERRVKAYKRSAAYAARFPERRKATSAVRSAILSGRLVKKPCAVCGRKDTHGHHDDYSKPLHVRWLCPIHHAEAHGRMKPL